MAEILIGILVAIAELIVVIVSSEDWDAVTIGAILGPILTALGIREAYLYAKNVQAHKTKKP